MNIFIFTRQTAARMLAAIAVLSLVAGLMPMQTAFAAHDPFGGVEQSSVLFCHQLGNGGYNTPNASVTATGGQVSLPQGHSNAQHSGDIIPPFHFDGGFYPGQNWNASTEDIWASGNCTGDGIIDVLGCTDPAANNYNPAANTNDGSCTYDVLGCTDSTADNYNPTANSDDGSCTYTILGCTDSGANNYNPNANSDDGSCTFDPGPVLGCTDSTANNYNPLADTDDGSCTFDPVAVLGCTDPLANNYDSGANTNDGSCTYDVLGCTEPLANNYNPLANTSDGSCAYDPAPQLCTVEIVSDTNTYVIERDASAEALSFVHPAWTASIPGATWIWADDPVADPANEEIYTFASFFGFEGTVTNATLEIASDNAHGAILNAGALNSFGSSFNNVQSYNVTSDIAQGNNDLLVEVTNDAGSSDPAANPAGVLYKLTIEGEVTSDDDCSVDYVPPVPPTCNDGIQNQDETGVDTGGVCGNGGGGNGPDPVCTIGDNLLSNGSFEEPIADQNSHGAGFWELFDSIPNWVSTGGFELWNNMFGGASDGDQNAELAVNGPTEITQTIATVPGATYEFRFDFAARDTDAADNNVDALIDGGLLLNANSGNTSWVTYSDTFVAVGTTTDIGLKDVGTANGTGSLVDNAVVCFVSDPVVVEPDTYLVFGYVWHDDNENQDWDGFMNEEESQDDEDPLAGWTVEITNGSTTLSTTTDSTGYYYFDVPEGTWTITEVVMEGWDRTTQESFVVIVPEVEAVTLLDSIFNFIIPTAHAQAAPVTSSGPYNFGNNESDTTTTPDDDRRNTSTGTRVGGRGGRVAGTSTSAPGATPLVLGEQVDAVPTGAPNAGAGGAAPVTFNFLGNSWSALLTMSSRRNG